ncbi:hypothetical protein RJ639_013464 [Escallonia herrerae]|uniref:Uncharacterized protein n=1 Tax=Escallonia herrerae TaxID=1293975 RepID=A0AA88VFR3_9ASTE|nr:hypothetical protein RJ639_013464 [Escallonia herrerae]
MRCGSTVAAWLVGNLAGVAKKEITEKEELRALDYKYKAEEEGTNKYLIAQYFDFVMVDDKPLLEQVHALQVIVNTIRTLKISLPESFQVGVIIAKLPPSWKDYRKKLLHKSEDFTLEQFQKHLRIEEESLKRENKVTVLVESNVHYMDGSGSQSKNPALQVRKNDEQFKKKANQDGEQKKKKGSCYVCGKKGALDDEHSSGKTHSWQTGISTLSAPQSAKVVARLFKQFKVSFLLFEVEVSADEDGPGIFGKRLASAGTARVWDIESSVVDIEKISCPTNTRVCTIIGIQTCPIVIPTLDGGVEDRISNLPKDLTNKILELNPKP